MTKPKIPSTSIMHKRFHSLWFNSQFSSRSNLQPAREPVFKNLTLKLKSATDVVELYKTKTQKKNFNGKIEKKNEDINLIDEIVAWQSVDKVINNYKTKTKLSGKEIKD